MKNNFDRSIRKNIYVQYTAILIVLVIAVYIYASGDTVAITGFAANKSDALASEAYFCQEENVFCIGILTGSSICQYNKIEEKNIICSGNWTVAENNLLDADGVYIKSNNCFYRCDITSGKIQDYTKCYCGDNFDYFGEL